MRRATIKVFRQCFKRHVSILGYKPFHMSMKYYSLVSKRSGSSLYDRSFTIWYGKCCVKSRLRAHAESYAVAFNYWA